MGALTVNRKRGFDRCSPNYIHSPVSNNTQFSKKPKISPFTDPIPISSQKGKSRYYLYPEPVIQFKREVHAPCRVTKFGSLGSRNSHKVVEKENFDDEMGNVFGSPCELSKRIPTRNSRFWMEKEEEVIDVDDVAKGDIEVLENGDVMETDLDKKDVENDTEVENSEMETECDEKDLGLKVENDTGIENGEEKTWDLVSLNKKLSLLGRPVYKQLLEDAESHNSKLSSLSFQIKLAEKQLGQFQLLRTVKQPEEEVVLDEVLREAFVPLTKEERVEVSRAFSDSNRRKVLATHDNSNIAITGQIIQCLKPMEWLNDEVINVYLELLKEREWRDPKRFSKCHFFNTFFYKKLTGGQNLYDYKSVRRWTTQRKLGYALIDCEKIFVPIHKPYHWCLAVINKKDKNFQYLDSLGGTDSYVLKALHLKSLPPPPVSLPELTFGLVAGLTLSRDCSHGWSLSPTARYYVEEVKDKSGENIDVSSWKQEYVKDLPAQKNGFDCGVFMVKYTDFYSRGLGLFFKQDDMPYFRLRTAKEILKLRAE